MSVKALSAVFEDSQARNSAFTVLLAMADWADQNGRCYPSYGQIAAKARVSRAMAIAAVRELIELGEVERIEQGQAPLDTDDEAPKNVRAQWRNLYRIALIKPHAKGVQNLDHLETTPESALVVQKLDRLTSGEPAQVVQLAATGSPDSTAQVVQSVDPHIRIRPSGRPSGRPSDLQAVAAPQPPEEKSENEDAENNLGVITKIAHEAFDVLGLKADLGDVAEAVKSRCAKLRVCYAPGDVVRRAIDSARWQRQRRQPEVH